MPIENCAFTAPASGRPCAMCLSSIAKSRSRKALEARFERSGNIEPDLYAEVVLR